MFYHSIQKGKHIGEIYGFPTITRGWCRHLKIAPQEIFRRGILSTTEKGKKKGDDNRIPDGDRSMVQFRTEDGSTKFLGKSESEVVQYLGIAVDEPKRIKRHKDKANILLPLVEAGWSEDYCRKWCEENDLLSPIYTTGTRGGCWFCHMQRIDSLRELRHDYPDLWALMLKWDTDSPVTFRVGVTVHDLDRRFELEDRQGKLW